MALRADRYARILHPLQVGGPSGLSLRAWSETLGPNFELTADLSLRDALWNSKDFLEANDLRVEPQIGFFNAKLGSVLANLIAASVPTDISYFYFWNGLGGFGDGRSLYLYRGSIRLVERIVASKSPTISPTLWWGEENDWFVVTHIDSPSTYVGGPATVIDRILECEDLESLPVNESAIVDDVTGPARTT